MSAETDLTELEFTVNGFVSRTPSETYEAVTDPASLPRYFTTAGAVGRLEAGATVHWDFADFPGAFPVEVLEAVPGERIVISWGGEAGVVSEGNATRVSFEFRSVDGGARTEVRITERSWVLTRAGAQAAFGNCMGWTGFLAALKVWLEHGIVLRDGFYK